MGSVDGVLLRVLAVWLVPGVLVSFAMVAPGMKGLRLSGWRECGRAMEEGARFAWQYRGEAVTPGEVGYVGRVARMVLAPAVLVRGCLHGVACLMAGLKPETVALRVRVTPPVPDAPLVVRAIGAVYTVTYGAWFVAHPPSIDWQAYPGAVAILVLQLGFVLADPVFVAVDELRRRY